MPNQEKLALELLARETKTAIEKFVRVVADFNATERELQEAERRAGLEVAPQLPVLDRMARLGFSDRTRDTIREMLAALGDVANGRRMSGSALAILRQRRNASQSADRQLAAIAAARRKSIESKRRRTGECE
jgi:hypothetical protein